MDLFYFFSKKSKTFMIVLGIALICVVSLLDYLTGDIPFSIFYLIPICFITWYTGTQTGILTSVACALIYFFDEYTDVMIPAYWPLIYWNATIILGFFLVVTYSLSRLKSALDKEKIYSRTDYLTQALNGRSFRELVENELIRAKRYERQITVVYIDLDDFKLVNDTFGHSVGDELLCQVVQTIRNTLRRTDVVARLGGDEFAVLLPETSSEQAKVLIDRIQEFLVDVMRENKWPVTFSIGVASFVRPPSSFDELIKAADSTMYTAKKDGKNKVSYAVIGMGPLPPEQGPRDASHMFGKNAR